MVTAFAILAMFFFIFLLYIQIYFVRIYFVCIVFLKLKLNNRLYKNHILTECDKYLNIQILVSFSKCIFICIIFMINLQFVFCIQRPKLLISDIIFIRIYLDINFLIWIYSDIWLYKCQCSETEFWVKFSQFQPTATWRIKIN